MASCDKSTRGLLFVTDVGDNDTVRNQTSTGVNLTCVLVLDALRLREGRRDRAAAVPPPLTPIHHRALDKRRRSNEKYVDEALAYERKRPSCSAWSEPFFGRTLCKNRVVARHTEVGVVDHAVSAHVQHSSWVYCIRNEEMEFPSVAALDFVGFKFRTILHYLIFSCFFVGTCRNDQFVTPNSAAYIN